MSRCGSSGSRPKSLSRAELVARYRVRVTSPEPTAAKLVGLLADHDRLVVVSCMVLGASTVEAVIERSGLEPKAAHDAVGRLASGGLVIVGRDGTLVLLEAAFGAAARASAEPSEPAANPTERVIRTFVADGRLKSIPTARSKRVVVLELIAQDFEPGLKYSELEVNAIVGRWHDDYAAIRRYLIDESFLDRGDGVYWRSGGAVHSIND